MKQKILTSSIGQITVGEMYELAKAKNFKKVSEILEKANKRIIMGVA